MTFAVMQNGAAAPVTGADNDPLVVAITAYRTGLAAFDHLKEEDWPAYGGEEAIIERTYLAPQRVLNNWSRPVTSPMVAIEALKFAQEEIAAFGESEAANAMIRAVRGYLEAHHTGACP